MLLRLYRGIGPGTMLVLLVTAMLVWLMPLLHPVEPAFFYDTQPMPLYSLLINFFRGKPEMAVIFIFVLVLALSTYLVAFNTRLFFINERTFLPASVYILLSGTLPGLQTLNPVVPSALLLMVAIDRIIASYRKPGIAYNFYDSALIIGLASLFYINIIWFFLIVIIGMQLIRTFSIRELLISIFGVATPYIVLYSFYYISGRDIGQLNDLIISGITTEVNQFYWSPLLIVLGSVNILILLVSLFSLLRSFNTKKVRSRKTFSLLIWVMIVSLLAFFLVPSVSIEMVYLFLIPETYIITHYLVFMRNKKIANMVFAIIMISTILVKVL